MPSEKVSELFLEALELPAEKRGAFLERAAPGDGAIRREVEALLQALEADPDFLEAGALSGLASIAREMPTVGEFGPGDAVGDFVILRELGRGGLATVYLATQRSLGREVALKVSPNLGNEARSMAPLEHDNIVKVFSETLLEEQGVRLLSMQYVPGSDLKRVWDQASRTPGGLVSGARFLEWVRESSGPSPEPVEHASGEPEISGDWDALQLVVETGIRLSEALAAAHARGVVHLDIKPANILISRTGRPMVADFNTSLRRQGGTTESGLRGATPHYVAPEYLRLLEARDERGLESVDGRADVYSGPGKGHVRPGRPGTHCRFPKPLDRKHAGRGRGLSSGRISALSRGLSAPASGFGLSDGGPGGHMGACDRSGPGAASRSASPASRRRRLPLPALRSLSLPGAAFPSCRLRVSPGAAKSL